MAEGISHDERALSPVVEKTVGAGLTVLFVGGMVSLLFGGVVPQFQNTAGQEVSERTLATAAGTLERAYPESDGRVSMQTSVSLPPSIENDGYRLILENGTLRLAHPDPALERETTVALPGNATTRESSWHSGSDLVIRIVGPADNRTVEITDP